MVLAFAICMSLQYQTSYKPYKIDGTDLKKIQNCPISVIIDIFGSSFF